jgi:hypothetical protein
MTLATQVEELDELPEEAKEDRPAADALRALAVRLQLPLPPLPPPPPPPLLLVVLLLLLLIPPLMLLLILILTRHRFLLLLLLLRFLWFLPRREARRA